MTHPFSVVSVSYNMCNSVSYNIVIYILRYKSTNTVGQCETVYGANVRDYLGLWQYSFICNKLEESTPNKNINS